ncbi:MAG: PKD domain-containing protein, partial [Desulfobacterales bacterium]|nr:PKD domain-containing protein [Desulfobacterales bacterium]
MDRHSVLFYKVKSLVIAVILALLIPYQASGQDTAELIVSTSSFSIPVTLDEEKDIESIAIDITGYDVTVIEETGAELTGGILENSDYLIFDSKIDDNINIVSYSMGTSVTGKGDIVFINFDVKGQGSVTLSITKYECNELSVSGGFNIDGAVYQNVEVVINFAPVLDDTQSPALTTIDEDNFDNGGDTIAEIIADGSITDDDQPIENIAVTAVDNTNGKWQYSLDNGTAWTDFSEETGILVDISSEARLLDGSLTGDETNKIRFVPNPGWSGTPAFTFRGWDKSSGETGQTADAVTGGGISPFSLATDNAVIEIIGVNDAPVLDNTMVHALTAIDEDTFDSIGNSIPEIIADDSVTDQDGIPAEAIAVTGVNNVNGSWEYSVDNGISWTVFTAEPNIADLSAQARLLDETHKIRFVPNADWNGTAAFSFRAWDKTSGTAGQTADASTGGDDLAFSEIETNASITVNSINDAPVLDDTQSPAFTSINEDDTGSKGDMIGGIIPDNTITDADGATKAIAVIIVNNINGIWQFSTDSGTTWVNFSDVTGAKDYFTSEARLLGITHKIRFVPNPDWHGTTDITFRAWDKSTGTAGETANASAGGGTLAFSEMTDKAEIEVKPVNDAPVLDDTASPSLTAIDEDDISDGNSVGEIVVNGSVSDTDGFPTESVAVTAVDNTNGKWQFSADNGATWKDFTAQTGSDVDISGTAVMLDADDSRIKFISDDGWNGTASFTFRAWDMSSGTSGETADTGTNGGTSPFSSATNVAVIEVNALNDAPVLDNTATHTLTAIDEDDADNNGNTVAEIVADGSISDIDDDSPAEAVAVTAVDNTNGKWQFSTDSANWADFTVEINADADISDKAVLLDSTCRIRFVPNPDWHGTAAFIFRAWDMSSGVVGGTANASVGGGMSAFSEATDNAGIVVGAVNDAPVLDNTASPELSPIEADNSESSGNTVDEIVADNSITDADTDSPVKAIAVTSVDNTNGKWQFSTDNGTSWTDFSAQTGIVDITSNARLLDPDHKIRLVPNTSWIGESSFTFRAWDKSDGVAGQTINAGNPGGTSAVSSETENADIEVQPGNYAPVLDSSQSPRLSTISQDDFDSKGNSVAEIVVDGSVTDPDGSPTEAIAITSVDNTNGKWQFSVDNGNSWYDISTETGAEIDITAKSRLLDEASKIRFVPVSGWEGTATFTFRAWDKSSGTVGDMSDTSDSGGISAFSSNADEALIEVSTEGAINDAPILDTSYSPVLTAISENDTDNNGNSIAEIVVNGSVTDADGPAFEAIAVISLDNTNGIWQYSLSNGVSWTNFTSQAHLLDGTLTGDNTHRIRFVPNPDWSGTATFSFRAWDKSAGTAGETTIISETGGTSAFSSDADDAETEVTEANHAPVLDNTFFPLLSAIETDVFDSVGNTVSEIVADGSITDADGTSEEAIAVTAVDNINGMWQFSTDNGSSWTDFSSITGNKADLSTNARLLDSVHRIRFVPNSEWEGISAFTFRAWDKTAGTSGETADAGTPGEISPFSLAEDDASIEVSSEAAVNNAPVLDAAQNPMLDPIANNDLSSNGNSISEIVVNGSITDTDGPALEAIAVVAVNNTGGIWQYSINNGSTWENFTDETGTIVDISGNAVLLDGTLTGDETQGIRFVPADNQTGMAAFIFRAWDKSTGTAGQTADASEGGGTSAFSLATDDANIEVKTSNYAPILDISPFPKLSAIGQDDFDSNGNSVAEIVADGSVTDADGLPTETIAVTAVDNTNGKWQFSLDNGDTWDDISAETGSLIDITTGSLLLDETSRIRFVPDSEWEGLAAFNFRAWDMSDGAVGDTSDTSDSGGISAFSLATDEAVIEVSTEGAINDAPVLDDTFSPILTPIDENDTESIGNSIAEIVVNGSVTDEDGPAFEAIAVTALDNTNGVWQYSVDDGIEWTDFTSETGDIADISSQARLLDGTLTLDETHRIRFVPDPDWNGTATFSFRAWDKSAGTAGETEDTTETGGTSAFSSDEDDAEIEVMEINQAPVLDPTLFPVLTAIGQDVFDSQGNTVAEIVADGSITDANGRPEEAIAVTSVDNTNGTWEFSTDDGLSWTEFADSTTGEQVDISAEARLLDETGKIRFVPDPEWEGTAAFTFRAWDKTDGIPGETADTSETGGSSAFSLAEDDAYIEVSTEAAINDAPVLDTTQSPELDRIDINEFDSNGNSISEIVVNDSVTDADGPALEAIAVVAADNTNGTWQYSIDDGLEWKDITEETGDIADISDDALLLDGTLIGEETHKIRFVPIEDWKGTAVFTFRAWDKSEGEAGETADANEGGGESAFSSDTDDADIEVNSPNNAPVLDDTQSPVLTVIYQNYTENNGDTVAEIVADDSITDADGSVEAIAVISVDNTNGQWEYSVDDGDTWTAFTDETDDIIDISAQARLLDETGRIRFVPAETWTGIAAITFRAWDMSTGETGQAEDPEEGGGESAFSKETDEAVIEVKPQNNPPILDDSFSPALDPIDEDDSENIGNTVAEIVADGSITDEDDPVEAVAVTAVDNTDGIWQYSTNNVTWTDFTAEETGAEIDMSAEARLLDGTAVIRFVPDTDWSGTSSFTFRAWDMSTGETGETADTSEDSELSGFSSATDNADIEVNPVNDAPVLDDSQSPVLTVIDEDDFDNSGNTVAEIVEDGSVDDADGSPKKAIAVISLDNTNGAWEYSSNGTDWSDLEDDMSGGAVLLDETYRIRFVPDPGWSGTASFTFRAWDMSSGEPGQTADPGEGGDETAFSSASDEAVITVNMINNAPVLDPGMTPALSSILKNNFDSAGNAVSEIVIDDTVTDDDGSPVEAIAVVSADNTNGTWEYSPDGSNWTDFANVTSSNSVLLDENYWIRFVPDPGWSGSASFTFRAWDKSSGNAGETANTGSNGGTSAFSSETDEAFINVKETNTAPVLDTSRSHVLTAIYENNFDSTGNRVSEIVADGSVSDADGTATEAVAVTDVDNTNGRWQYSVGETWTDFQGNISGNHLLLDGNHRIRFVPAYDWAGTATFTFRAWDKSSGRAGTTTYTAPGGGSAPFSSATDKASVTVRPVNHAPQLDSSRYPDMTSITENTFDSRGNFVEQIFVDGSVTDPDGPATETMAIVGVDNTNGRWQYSSDDGITWNNFTSGAGYADMSERSMLVTEKYKIRFIPNAGWSGIATFKFRAWDKSEGTAGHQADTRNPGETSAFSWNADDASIMVISVPVANAGTDQTVEEGSFVKLDGAGSTGTIATYKWTQTGGTYEITLSDSMGIQPTFTAPDVESGSLSLSFMLTVQDNNGLESSDSVNITVNNVAAPVASFIAGITTGNVPLDVIFTDTSQGNVTELSWDFGDGFQSMAQNPAHTYTTAGIYSVSLSVKGRGGEDTTTVNDCITVNIVPLKADFEALPITGTAPLGVSFTQKSEGEITEWHWDFGDGKTADSAEPVHAYESPGNYTVSLTISGPAGSETETKQDLVSVIERTLSGQVTAEDTGEGLEDCWVEVWSGDLFINGAVTDPDGNYTITGLSDIDNLTVVAWPPETLSYYEQYYDGKDIRNQADPVSLVEESLSDTDFVLKKTLPYGISGRVHDGENGIADIEVNIFSESIVFSMNTVTGENGEYSVTGLRPADDYVVSVRSDLLGAEFYYAIPEQETVGVFVPDSSALTENRATFVSPEDPPVPHIDIIVDINQGGSIEGYVYSSDQNNAPVKGLRVDAWSDYLETGNNAVTDSTGHYIIQGLDEITPDEAETKGYTVDIKSADYMYQAYDRADRKEDAVKVATQTSEISFYIKSVGTISGRITNTGGIPVPGVSVTAVSVSDSEQKQGTATSDEAGFYTITDLPAADDYIIGVFPSSDYPIQYYNLKPDEKTANTVDLTHGDVSDINFALDKGGVMKGAVFIGTHGAETAPAGITVNIWSDSTGTGGDVKTDENGRYEIAGLNRDTIDYVVSVRHTGYVQAYHSHDRTVYKWEDAARIAPSESLDRNIVLVTGFSIKGKVVYNGESVANIRVEAEGTVWGSAVTTLDDEYNYTITGLVPGTYNIIIQADGYMDMIQEVVVDSQNVTTEFVLEKEPDRTLSGTITGLKSGRQVTVSAWSVSRDVNRTVQTDGTGEPVSYTITKLKPSDDYIVGIVSDDYPYQVYNGRYNLEDADLVNLSEQDASDIDFTLTSDTSVISGQVIFPGDAAPGDTVRIDVSSRKTGAGTGVEIKVTDSQIVQYTLKGLIPADDYILYLSSDKYINQFFNGEDFGTRKEEDALYIDTVENSEYIADFRVSKGATISGTIVDKNEQGLAETVVEAWSSETGSSGYTLSSGNGTYAIEGLGSATDYIVKAWDIDTGSFFYNSERTVMNETSATYVSTAEGDVSDIDIKFIEMESISGTVSDLEGFPLHRMWVEANSDLMDTGHGVFTDEDGNYVINGLPSSMDYLVSARPDWYTIPKEKFPVASGSTGVNFTLNPREGHTIRGTVIDNMGNPVADTRVEAWSDTYGIQGDIWAVTDRFGKYELNGLPPGDGYMIMAWPPEDSDYAFFSEKGHSVPMENDNMDISLAYGLEISGTVTGADNSLPLENIQVIAVSTEKYFSGKTLTDKNGFYEITNAPEGSDYEVTVIGKDAYSGQKKKNQYPGSGTDFALESSGSITGQVRVQSTGNPLGNVLVEAYSKSMQGIAGFEGTGITDKNGYYEIKGLRKKNQKGNLLNDYVVIAYSQNYPSQSKGGKKVNDYAEFLLSRGRENKISGTIMGSDGELLEGIDFIAEVFEQSGKYVTFAKAESSGAFQFNILEADKQYLLKVTAYNGDDKILVQWCGESEYDYDVGIENPDDPDEPPASAKAYSTDTSVDFRFSINIRRTFMSAVKRRDFMGTTISSTTHTDILSPNPFITVTWEPFDETDEGYYYEFNEEPEHRVTKRNAPPMLPIKVRQVTSAELTGNNVSFYFHVAAVDNRGRIGFTSRIEFRIDTVPPSNGNVIVPETSSSRIITMTMGVTDAKEMYISNTGYGQGGEWETRVKTKQWEVTEGDGVKELYVQFRDEAENTANYLVTLEKTLFKENSAPVIDDQTFSVDENSPDGTVVGTASATDADPDDTLSYFITAGNADSIFDIDTGTGEITVGNGSLLDYETADTYVLTVEVFDGLDATTATITINIKDVDETKLAVNDQVFSVNENSENGTHVGKVAVTGADDPGVLTFT